MLGDLESMGQIAVEVVLSLENAASINLAPKGKGCAYCLIYGVLVEDWKGSRI